MAMKQLLIGNNSRTIRSNNLQAILLALLHHKHISRIRLAELTSLSTTTITNLITELLKQGIVAEEGTNAIKQRSGAGRPRMSLRLVPESRYAIGVHIGVGSVKVAVTDLRANILTSLSLSHPLDRSAVDVLAEIAQLVQQAITQLNIDPQNIIGVGVGASGLVNPDTGVNLIAPNLGWRDVAIKRVLSEHLTLPICVDNNVRAMALGESLFGSVPDVRLLAFVYVRIGVGAGFVIDGQLYRGSGAGAGEIGHTTMMPDNGERCHCGNTGCLETLISEPAIMKLAHVLAKQDEHGLLANHFRQVERPTIEQVFAAARDGDVPTQNMLAERARYMGVALSNLINIFNPELIVFGGIFSQGYNLLLPTVEATIRQRTFADLGQRVKFQPTYHKKNSGMVGSAALALTTFFYQPAINLT
ncbi:ROK family protein [Anaerolineales bacterium HSG24]|nr:ROK family protein [Anaerolineales bacterium HSG24]